MLKVHRSVMQRDGKRSGPILRFIPKPNLEKINLSGTGGGPPKHHPLTPLEEKVSELLDLGEAIDGMNGSLSFGLQDTSMSCSQDHKEAEMFEVIAETQTNDNISQKVNLLHPRKTPKKRQSLLKKQVEHQIRYQSNSTDALKEININLKGILKYQKRDSELNEKKLQIEKRQAGTKKT
ncbi:uncharacterized protein LOC129941013 isoform X1 [Eupeodes corollae]|uniref:uncharacterized protein LOC129941013 isoform X1 n=1 Tax=Eupeodes corollae TaxID=290404 RepID=UPI0024932D11|nr:uncharacterized protein LOC129941013 isoform X1 [Eupeodes corollae]